MVIGRSIEDSVHLLRSSAATCVAGSPQHLRDVLFFASQRTRGGPFGSVRRIVTGGGHISKELIEMIRASFNAELVYNYASTEAGSVGFANIHDVRAMLADKSFRAGAGRKD